MSKEIVEAVKALEQEKGISAEKLMDALEDALLSAYKKTPGAAKYARVDLDHETGDFLVFELMLPPELEEKLLAEAGWGGGSIFIQHSAFEPFGPAMHVTLRAALETESPTTARLGNNAQLG